MKKAIAFVYFFVCATLLFSRSAFAYIDPSSMTYLIQIVAGAAIALGAGVGFYWKRIRRFFRNKRKAREEARLADAAARDEDASM